MKKLASYAGRVALALAVLILVETSSVFAFSKINFENDTQLAQRYDKSVQSFRAQYQTLGITSNRRIATMEKRISLAYKNLTKARTVARKNRFEAMIIRHEKNLSDELLRLQKSKPPVSTTSKIESSSPSSPPPPPLVTQISEVPTWENVTPADFLYYANNFEGGKTANGNIFQHAGFSAARCDIPLNTLLQLRYGDTGVIVKANDRPNCTKHADIVDLTRTAFMTMGPLSRGRLSGTVNTLGTIPKESVKQYLPRDYFKDQGIEMDANIPNMYLPNETLKISGVTTNGEAETLIYIITPSGKKISFGLESVNPPRFEYYYPLVEVGYYEFVIASGRSFSGVRALSFTVLDPQVLNSKQYFVSAPTDTVTQIQSERREAGDLTATHEVQLENVPNGIFRGITIESESAKVSRTGMSKLAFLPTELKGFKPGQKVQVTVTGRTSSTAFSHDTYSTPSVLYSKSMIAGPLYRPERNIKFKTWTVGNTANFVLSEESFQKISGTVDIITPAGKVEKILFPKSYIGTKGSLTTSQGASFSYVMREVGVYLFEVNYETGFPAIIEPVVNGNVLAILPNEFDFVDRTIESSQSVVVSQTLNSINKIREQAGLNSITIDPTLMRLAQFKAQDMSDGDYVGHVDSQGGYILDMSKRLGIDVSGNVGENVAGGTVSAAYLQAGLSLSGGHRANMLGNWSKVGIGVVIKNGKVHLAQVFGE